MSTEFPWLDLVPMAEFALAAGALVVRYKMKELSAKLEVTAAALFFLLLCSSFILLRNAEERRQIRRMADDIADVIGNEKRTAEDILGGLKRPNDELANAAIDMLLEQHRIQTKVEPIADSQTGASFRVRVFFVRRPAPLGSLQ